MAPPPPAPGQPDGARPASTALRTAFRIALRALALAAALLLLGEGWIFARVIRLRGHEPGPTAFMRARLRELRASDPEAALDQSWVSYARISPELARAVLAGEDSTFATHRGFDWEGIREAYEKNRRRGRLVAGGSTITQQLAKNLFLSRSRTPWRKAEEAVVTVMLEAALPKRRILELYLNVIEWGDRTWGAEAAARHWFGVPAAALTAEQAARLAAMIPSPRRYERRGATPYLARQAAVIRARMDQVRLP